MLIIHTEVAPLLIEEIPSAEAPMDLLLLADPSVDKINGYLPGSRCFVAYFQGALAGVCVVKPIAPNVYELMSIAVTPADQKHGIGTQLLKYVIAAVGQSGAQRLQVGTGTFGYQLAFYQRHGFRVTGVDRDFFLSNDAEPIFEGGIQLKDMLRLSPEYPKR